MRNYERDSYGEPRKVTCNQWGRVIVKQNGILREDVCCIQKKWGYFSKKDGEIHSFVLCEACYDRFIKGFQVPVTIETETELM